MFLASFLHLGFPKRLFCFPLLFFRFCFFFFSNPLSLRVFAKFYRRLWRFHHFKDFIDRVKTLMVVAIWSFSLTLKIPRFHDDLTLKGSLSRFHHHHNLTSKVFAMTSWAKGFFDAALALTAALVMTALFRLAAKRDTWLVTGIFAGSSLANRDAQLALNGSKASMGESSSTPFAKLANPFPTLLFDWWER